MFFSTLVTTAAFAATVFSSPIAINQFKTVHEKRTGLPNGWIKRDALDRRAILPMKIALAQSNLDKGSQWLDEVSDPDSDTYGHHWSAKEIAEAFAPSSDSINAVKAWLASAGIPGSRVKHGQSLGFLEFDATVDEAENLLDSEYHVYEHTPSGQPHVACEEYSIPAHLSDHIDFVYPTVHFDAKVKRDGNADSIAKRGASSPSSQVNSIGSPGSFSLPKQGKNVPSDSIITELANCDVQIVPDCLRALYSFPKGSSANPKNSYGIVEYTPQAYLPHDLDLFFANFSKKQVGDRPIFDSIDGGVLQTQVESFDYNGESDLDLEYSMTLVYPQKVTLYQVGDLVEGASFNNFLDAIDASYCTFRGGDSKNDPHYPDPAKGGYKGPENCGGFTATKVISTSYAFDEASITPFYERRQCAEYMKLGLMGVSVLYSSGDSGVAGGLDQCINASGQINGTTGRFNPSFPGTCPYVTSVGATQVKPGVNVPKALASGTQPEEACETVIYSGGGFSNVFPLPSYQEQAVKSYFANYPPPYTAAQYNNSEQTRGFPDISANGANYVIAVDGNFSLVYGTSASSPTLGSILTLINEERYNHGQSSIGFINPVAYKHPEVFNDITQGNNPGCGTQGFSAVPGWDPVTGLGTPNYPKMLKLWLSLGNGGGWNGGS